MKSFKQTLKLSHSMGYNDTTAVSIDDIDQSEQKS